MQGADTMVDNALLADASLMAADGRGGCHGS